MYQKQKMDIRVWLLFLTLLFGSFSLFSQCEENLLINQGFETVGPPCGPVPPNGLINGSFNQGCMTGWEAAWGTPSVCSVNPSEGEYFACLGANNEGFFQTLDLSPDSTYCLSFNFRRLNGGSGSLAVYLASGLVNQSMANSGTPPITVQPTWQLLGLFPATGNQWEPIVIPGFVQLDPANTQLLFLDVPIGGLDIGIDDVKLSIVPELLIAPQNLVFHCSGVVLEEVEQWLESNAGASAMDMCGEITWVNNFSGLNNEDSLEVFFEAENQCFNTLSFSAFIIQSEVSDTIVDTMYTCNLDSAGIDTLLQINQACSLLVITYNVYVPDDLTFDSITVCDPLLAGVDTTYFINTFGCDSLFIHTSLLAPSDTIRTEEITCDPLLVGVDTTYLINRFGCDSLYILTRTIGDLDTVRTMNITCDTGAVTSDTIIFIGLDGCDSVVINTFLFSGGPSIIEDEIVICAQGVNYSDTTIIESDPCDSIFITNYLFEALDTTLLMTRVCNPADTGTFSMVLQGVDGCDSLILETYIYIPPDTLTVTEYVCLGPDTLVVSSLLTDQFGCDSLFSIEYQLNVAPDTQFVEETTCDSFMMGLSTMVIPGQYCDTVRVIETLWLPVLITLDTQRLCTTPMIEQDTFYYISSQGCDSLLILYYLSTIPVIDILTEDETCAGFTDASIMVSSVEGGLPPYVFSLNNGPFDTIATWSFLPPGEFVVITQDAAMCSDTADGIILQAGPLFLVDAGPDVSVTKDEVVPIQLTSVDDWSSVFWEAINAVQCPTCPGTFIGPITQEQLVYLTIYSDAGCTAKDSFSLFLEEIGNYFLPNIFSPDEDGNNDYFFLSASASVVTFYDMIIFDRWGNQVFNAFNISANDPLAGWNGLFRNEKLNPGVFTYVIEVKPDGSLPKILTGNVTIVR